MEHRRAARRRRTRTPTVGRSVDDERRSEASAPLVPRATARRAPSRSATRVAMSRDDCWSSALCTFSATRPSGVSAALIALMIVGDLVRDLGARRPARRSRPGTGPRGPRASTRSSPGCSGRRCRCSPPGSLSSAAARRAVRRVGGRRERDGHAVRRPAARSGRTGARRARAAAQGERRADLREVARSSTSAFSSANAFVTLYESWSVARRLVEHARGPRAARLAAPRRRRRASSPWSRGRRTAAGCRCTRGTGDLAALERGDVRVALADAELALDLKPSSSSAWA